MSYKMSVYIGRFAPIHNGHLEVLKNAFQTNDHVLILLGSSNSARTIKDPWTFDERKKLMTEVILETKLVSEFTGSNRFTILSLEDEPYNDQLWIQSVLTKIEETKSYVGNRDNVNNFEVSITGAIRDWSAYYLEMFPTLKKDLIQENKHTNFELNATDIRNEYFSGGDYKLKFVEKIMNVVPEATVRFLINFTLSKEYKNLLNEFNVIQKYKKDWSVAPYAPTFVTVDSVVIQSGHVLLVERKSAPGKGLWALPGGFVEQTEKLMDASIRELNEETKLKVPIPVIKGSFVSKEIFDHPNRSLRGRTFTVAFLYVLKDQDKLPDIKASDDAKAAKWISLSQVEKMKHMLFEDHFSIISTMVNRISN